MGNNEINHDNGIKNDIIELYKLNNDMVKFFSERGWETIKYFTTIFLALLTASSTLLGYFILNNELNKFIFLLLFFPISMNFLASKGHENFRREYDRLLERVAIVIKSEELLGFHRKREEIKKELKIEDELKKFSDDKYLLSDDFIKRLDTIKKEKDFRKKFIQTGDYPFFFWPWLKYKFDWYINRKNRKISLDETFKKERLGDTYRIFGKIFRGYNVIAHFYGFFIFIIWLIYFHPIFIGLFNVVKLFIPL